MINLFRLSAFAEILFQDTPRLEIADIRHVLRRDTATIHQCVEDAFDLFDLRLRVGMERVLRAHYFALSRLLPSLAEYPDLHGEVARLRELAWESHREISETPLEDRSSPVRLNPLAVAYVILGSRLGARVIAARLDHSEKEYSAAATNYFTDDQSRPFWKWLLDKLQHEPGMQATLVADARLTFGIFLEEARAVHTAMQDAA